MIKILTALFIFSLLTACAQYTPKSSDFNELLVQPYALDTGDILRVNVFDQPNVTGTYAIDTTGHITLPLVGKIVARGLTLEKINQDITAKLAASFFRDPDVSVEIASYRAFFVMGEVTSAGQYAYVPGMTVETAVAIAGGFTPRAAKRNAVISRTINGKINSAPVEMNAPIRPGDTIYIKERWF